MNRMWLLALAVMTAAMAATVFQAVDRSEAKLKADVTIDLSGEILKNGGTVIVLPTKDTGHTINWDRDPMTTSVTVSAPVSIVFFDYPAEGTYVFRFGVKDPNRANVRQVFTQPISYGSGGYLDPKSNIMVNLDDIQTVMILGDSSAKKKSLGDSIKLTDIFASDPECEEFVRAKVCTERSVK